MRYIEESLPTGAVSMGSSARAGQTCWWVSRQRIVHLCRSYSGALTISGLQILKSCCEPIGTGQTTP
jgi:hypothetical protein